MPEEANGRRLGDQRLVEHDASIGLLPTVGAGLEPLQDWECNLPGRGEMHVQSDGPCQPCFWGTNAELVPIGSEVIKQAAFGRGYDRTRFEFAQCATCGSVWMVYTESGGGRHETLRLRMTKGFI